MILDDVLRLFCVASEQPAHYVLRVGLPVKSQIKMCQRLGGIGGDPSRSFQCLLMMPLTYDHPCPPGELLHHFFQYLWGMLEISVHDQVVGGCVHEDAIDDARGEAPILAITHYDLDVGISTGDFLDRLDCPILRTIVHDENVHIRVEFSETTNHRSNVLYFFVRWDDGSKRLAGCKHHHDICRP